jgi:hypothetical protein
MKTLMAEQLAKAGVDTDAALLNRIAVDLLRKSLLAPRVALDPFMEEVKDAGGIMAKLISPKHLEIDAINYLERVARDMRGDALKDSAKADGGGQRHGARDGQHALAPFANSRGEREGKASSCLRESARTLMPSPKTDGVVGQSSGASDGRFPNARPSSSSSGVAHARLPERAIIAVPSPGAPKRGLAELSVVRDAMPSIFDTQLLRDGTPLGDLRFSQIDRFIATNTKEAALLRLVRDHGQPCDQNARIRDIVNIETMQRMLQKAAEMVDAGSEVTP